MTLKKIKFSSLEVGDFFYIKMYGSYGIRMKLKPIIYKGRSNDYSVNSVGIVGRGCGMLLCLSDDNEIFEEKTIADLEIKKVRENPNSFDIVSIDVDIDKIEGE